MTTGRGLTLTELLVVITMILIAVAIATPRLFHSRIAANEATAISALQSLNRAQSEYHAAYPSRGFAARLSDLGGASPCTPSATSACLLDNMIANGKKSGYNFAMEAVSRADNGVVTEYAAGAAPEEYNKSGIRTFCTMSNAMIRYLPNTDRSSIPPDTAACRSAIPLE
jgi:prepilin-type N-terminal cleavage/methylation domain-containing protein